MYALKRLVVFEAGKLTKRAEAILYLQMAQRAQSINTKLLDTE
jgi:hypothetical protein